MKSRISSKIVSNVFAIILALAMTVPVGMLFSTSAIAENTEMTTLTESTDVDAILLSETSINPPTPLQIGNLWDTPPPISPFENITFVDYENLTYITDNNVSYEGPELPVFEHIEDPHNITLVTMNSPTGPLYEGKRRPIQVILKNKADHNIFNINVGIYDQLDDGEPMFLTVSLWYLA